MAHNATHWRMTSLNVAGGQELTRSGVRCLGHIESGYLVPSLTESSSIRNAR